MVLLLLATSQASAAVDPTNPLMGVAEKPKTKKASKETTKSSSYVLKSILQTDAGKFAVINNKVVKHKGRIDGYTIVINSLQSVLLKGEKKSQTLYLVPGSVRSR